MGSFPTGTAATQFQRILPDTAGHCQGRTVASFHEVVRWILVSYPDSITLNKALLDVNRSSMGVHEVLNAFAARFRDLREGFSSVYGQDWLKWAFVQDLTNRG